MRIADNMMYSQAQSGIQKNRTENASLQDQVATQKRITKPSDDPVAAARVLETRTHIANQEQLLKNIAMAKTFLEMSDQTLSELAETAIRLKEIALAQSNDGGANAVSRMTAASEVEQIFIQTVQMANRKFGDRYLFGGYRTTEAPFSDKGEYLGDHGEIRIEYMNGAHMGVNIPGSQAFLGLDVDKLRLDDGSPAAKELVYGGDESVPMRGPASLPTERAVTMIDEKHEQFKDERAGHDNIFDVIKTMEIGLRTNDSATIQGTIERLDSVLNQATLARAVAGSRAMALDSAAQSMQKSNIDHKALASSYEDADTFKLFSDLTKNENTLKATLSSSGKMVQMSLLDFLR